MPKWLISVQFSKQRVASFMHALQALQRKQRGHKFILFLPSNISFSCQLENRITADNCNSACNFSPLPSFHNVNRCWFERHKDQLNGIFIYGDWCKRCYRIHKGYQGLQDRHNLKPKVVYNFFKVKRSKNQ